MSNLKSGKLKNLKWTDRYTYVKNIVFTEKDLLSKGAKFQIVKFKPKTSIKPHYHKLTSEIFYIQSGTGVIKLNSQEFNCSPNDFFLCEQRDIHEFINNTDEDLIILIFKTNEVEDTDIYWV